MKPIVTLALDIDLRMAERLTLVQEELGPWLEAQGALARWRPAPQLRLPLKVIHEMEEALVPLVDEVITEMVAPLVPFKVEFEGLGVLPSPQTPRLLTVRASKGRDLILNLRKLLESRLEALGLPMDSRPFEGDLPLGRLCTPGPAVDLGAATPAMQALDFGESYVRSIMMVQTLKGPRGPLSEVLGRYSLGKY